MSPDPSPDHWTRVADVFDAVADLDTAERTAALDRLCRQRDGTPDPSLREEVESLLDADQAAATEPTFEVAEAAVLLDDEGSVQGERVGPWRVIREIGRGGMGRVDLVERADGAYDQQAALKRLGLVAPRRIRRFLRERQILASLRHPGIARLLDGGVDNGAPYLVMEYAEGEPITAYADRHGLGLRDRLALFVDVCDAVAYAHQRLVVHRDLKPSNILVGDPDDGGTPRVMLLDFGVARLLDPDVEDLITAEGPGAPLTPGYAAPEQIDGGDVTTATDVWALGVLLYELVAGRLPFPTHSRSAWVEAVRRAAPTLPSEVVKTASASGTATPPADAHRVRGDLDAICLAAIRTEPESRYDSASELRADVNRYLDGLPVEVRRPSAGYRIRRFVGRHRVGVAATVAAAAVAVLGTVFYTVRLADERDKAEQAAAEAAAVSETLASMFDRDPFAADPGRMDTVSVGQFVVDRSAAAVEELSDEPAVQARMLPLLARLHGQLGDNDRALVLARRAVALVDSLGSVSPALEQAARTELGTVLEARGEYAEAVVHFRRVVALADEVHGREHEASAMALSNLANAVADLGDSTSVAEAIRLGREALAISRRVLGDEHVQTAEAHNNLGTHLYLADRAEEAIPHVQRALAIRRVSLGKHPLVGNAESNLGTYLRELGRHEEAIASYDASIATYEATLGPEHPRLAAPFYGRAIALLVLSRLDEAERSARLALATDAAALPEDHPFLAYDHELLGDILMLRERWGEAETHLRRAIRLYGSDADDATLADARASLGRVTARTGRSAEARRLLTAARPHVSGPRRERLDADLAALPSP